MDKFNTLLRLFTLRYYYQAVAILIFALCYLRPERMFSIDGVVATLGLAFLFRPLLLSATNTRGNKY